MSRRKSGLGSITLLPNGKYRMRKQFGNLPNGRPRIITVTGTSETDCLRKMKKKEEEVPQRMIVGDSSFQKITLTELCEYHLEEHLNERGRLKPKAADRRESTIRNQIMPYSIGRIQAVNVNPQDVTGHIEKLIKEGKLSVSSICKTLDVINAAYKWAVDQEYIRYNPCKSVMDKLKNRLKNLEKRNSSDGVVIVLSEDQISLIEKYVDSISDKSESYLYIQGLSVLLLLYTGMRIGELCALRWSDWSEKTGTLDICKTRNVTKNRDKGSGYKPNENEVKNYQSRTIALSEDAKRVLHEIYKVSGKTDSNDYILVNKVEGPSNPSNYYRNINKFYTDAGLPKEITGAHILRRTYATQKHNDGCRVEDIAAYLGDTPETITKHYISLTKKLVADGEVLNVVQLPSKL